MEVTLAQILAEIKSVKVDLRAEMQDMKNELRAESKSDLQEQTKQLNEKLEQYRNEFKEDLQEQTKQLNEKLEQYRNEFKEDLQAQTREITQDYQDLIDALNRKYKRQEKINDEILRELRDNRLAHQSYDDRLYKIEISQRNLENKVFGNLPA